MKTFAAILSLILLVTCLGCQATPTPAPDVSDLLPKPGEDSLKGYELYSWQQDGKWVFSLLIGTNRQKTLAEIQSPQAVLTLDRLKAMLSNLPADSQINWLERDGLALPPPEVISEIQYSCLERRLQLLFEK